MRIREREYVNHKYCDSGPTRLPQTVTTSCVRTSLQTLRQSHKHNIQHTKLTLRPESIGTVETDESCETAAVTDVLHQVLYDRDPRLV